MVFRKSRMFPLSDSDLNVIPSLQVSYKQASVSPYFGDQNNAYFEPV